jgi:hypothetical protein
MRKFGPCTLLFILVFTTIFVRPMSGQQNKVPVPAPVPLQIASAQRVFISNSGAECGPFGQAPFSGGPDRAYNDFYAGMKAWGRYTIVNTPVESDLVMEIHFQCPVYAEQKVEKIVEIDPQFRLILLDPRTHIQLWAIIEHFNNAFLQENRDKDFGGAMGSLLARLKDVAAMASGTLKGG